jgi:hypothetical protein
VQQAATLTGFNFPSFISAISKPDLNLFAPKPVVSASLKPAAASLVNSNSGSLSSSLVSPSPSAVDQLFASIGSSVNTGLSNLLGPITTGLT